MAIKDVDRTDEVLKRLQELESMSVKVGILSSSSGEMLMIANVHEFGCDIPVTNKMRVFFLHNFGTWIKKDVIKIPERSFIRSSFDDKKDSVEETGENLITQVVEGQLGARNFYEMLGQTCVQVIKEFITAGISPANTNLTIQNKNGKSTPLIDSGRLINAIDYEIVGG
ncbi:hypothetical protein ING2D1G_0705 [Peptoniphilus sp. ING2-D1G]|nr:hypothetical protein ING2D1G_0705 [Peptoniphilus sp. ING2-D1G]